MKLFKRQASLNSLSPMIAPFLSYCSWTGGPADRRRDPEMDRDGPPGFHSRARGDSDRAWPADHHPKPRQDRGLCRVRQLIEIKEWIDEVPSDRDGPPSRRRCEPHVPPACARVGDEHSLESYCAGSHSSSCAICSAAIAGHHPGRATEIDLRRYRHWRFVGDDSRSQGWRLQG